jgi:hypothetical protein
LRKTALPPRHPVQAVRFEDPKGFATEPQESAFAPQAGGLKGNPSQRASRTSANSPAQFAPLGDYSFLGVLHANPLDRLRANAFKVLRRARRQRAQIKAGKPLAL